MLGENILNILTTEKKWSLCIVTEVIANVKVVIILQYRNIKPIRCTLHDKTGEIEDANTSYGLGESIFKPYLNNI